MTTALNALGAGPDTPPTSDKGRGANAAQVEEQDQGRPHDSDPTHCTDQAVADKAFATLRAQLALAGHMLMRDTACDGAPVYFAGRWGMERELSTLDDVRRFARLVGACK